MRKNYTFRPSHLLLATLTVASVSCMDKQYDMKSMSNINTDITFGGEEFALPIGSTEKVTLSKFIKENDLFSTNDKGEYVISRSGNLTVNLPNINIPAFAPEIPSIAPITLRLNTPEIPLPSRTKAADDRITADVPTQIVQVGGSMNNIPSEVVSLNSISIKQGGLLNVSIKVEGLPQSIQNLRFENFSITLPDYLKIAPSQELQGNTIVLDQLPIDRTNGFSRQLRVEGLAFAEPLMPNNGAMTIDGEAQIDGSVSVPLDELSFPVTGDITMRISLSITPMTPGVVKGIFNPQIAINPINFLIGDMPDLFDGPDISMDLHSIGVALTVNNPLGVKVVCGINISPYNKNNVLIPEGVVSQDNLTINAKPEGNPTPSTTRIWLSNLEEGKPNGYQWVKNSALPNIIKLLPYSIDFGMNAQVDQNTVSSIDLEDQPYRMSVDYGLTAPLAMGSQFSIGYTQSVKDLKQQLAQYLKNNTKAIIKAGIDNSVPLNFTLEAKAFDSDSLPVGVDIVLTGGENNGGTIAAGNKSGGATHSDIILTISEKSKGELAKMDRLNISFKGAANEALQGTALASTQYLKMSLSAKIPGGLTFNGSGQ